ncbi:MULTISPECIES: helix-turn-helix domain-containing protein [Streptomyces]|uniref:helix-turn-helix domain-containing protein n=1 Tax=Streptomyces TaxID=1883 RepID=UPI00163BF6DE|nr:MULTISPECIES: helix-turn-helix transcriptional regulator [Streptomyces]MBC2877009.1 helix-turn-helix domain-containing protein [Streptomyces sp. TYQ1024]UBI36033.1 helix-turn-helix domain-containing protein [Streptomyces mobaraensis]UKW28626.1 helix-turn-helix domain-containing protein [Streptomyces sp. TYQ1024]
MSARNAASSAPGGRRAFGQLLAHYRRAANETQESLAPQILCERSVLSRIETGDRVPSEQLVKRCDKKLGTGGALYKLWRETDWYPDEAFPDWFKRRREMDAKAVAIREFETQVVPGLLQSEEYSRALFSRGTGAADAPVIEERVRARLARQQRFWDPSGPLLVAVLDESAIRSVMGSAQVMYGQCAFLLKAGELPNVRIQVAPVHDPKLIRPKTPISLIQLPDGHQWVYSESLDRGHFSDDPAVVARHSRTYDVLRADSLSTRDSAAFIRDVMEEYGRGHDTRHKRRTLGEKQPQSSGRRKLHRNRPRYPRLHPRPGQ